VTAKGFGGACVHAILWGAVNFERVPQPKPFLQQQEIVFWPGGGGDLDDEVKPTKAYTIVGSWSSWSKPEKMKSEGKGAFSFTVALGELGFERFQIWLDGDPDRVLHPGATGATRDVPVKGPNSTDEAWGSYWMIPGLGRGPAPMEVLDEGHSDSALPAPFDDGSPGDRFQIQVLTNGRYRTVTWTKLAGGDGAEGALVPSVAGQYYLAASWSDWSLEELREDLDSPGTYRIEVRLPRTSGRFVFVRNEDWRQVLYPSSRYAGPEVPHSVLGPDEFGRGFEWSLAGSPGDVFEVELRRSGGAAGAVSFGVSWRWLRHDDLDGSQSVLARQPQFHIAGTWDHWLQRQPMLWDGECYIFEVTLRGGHPVNFLILADGDWNRALYPGIMNAGARDSADLRGPDAGHGNALSWMIGKEPEEMDGGRFEVQMKVKRGRPTQVSWARR